MSLKPVWFHILVALTHGTKHGADIQRHITESTGGAVPVFPVMLYGSLADMAERHWLEEVPPPEDVEFKETRRYYSITGLGRDALEAEAERMASLAQSARSALSAG